MWLLLKIRKRSKKGLVTISSSDGRWHGEWNSDYIFTLRDLQLEDLPEDGQTHTQVKIKLYIHKVSSNYYSASISY